MTGVDKQGVFVYRTIEDLESILEYAKQARSAAVIGGGLLGWKLPRPVTWAWRRMSSKPGPR